MSEEPLFGTELKKKSKKKTVDFAAALDEELGADAAAATSQPAEATAAEVAPPTTEEAAPAPADDGGADMFADIKKKPKKKKAIPLDLDALDEAPAPSSESAPADAEGAAPDDLDFGELKKKKKKSKKAAFDLDAFEKENFAGDENAAPGGGEGAAPGLDDDADLGDDPFAADDGDAKEGSAGEAVKETWLGTDRDYTYQELLGRIFATLRAQNPALSGDRKKYTIVPPSVQREGSKKTVFANVADICRRMHRQPEHVIQFLFAELGTMGSVDGSGRLVIKGRFVPKQIENVLRRYIVEYVTCKTCKSPQTLLTKENRIYFMTCESCGSQRSVSAIKTGFQAQTTKRSKMRQG